MAQATNQEIGKTSQEKESAARRRADDAARDQDVQRLRSEVAQTRSRLSDTLEQLSDRLSPRKAAHDLVDSITSSVDRSRVIGTLRDNPLPSLLIAAGAVWLAVESRSEPRARREGEGLGEKIARKGRRWRAKAQELAQRGKEKIGQATESAQQGAEETGQGVRERLGEVSEKAGQVKERISQRAHETADRVRAKAGEARERMGEASDRVRDAYWDHPLTAGALAIVAGLVAGAMLPPSRKEDELMGETRDKILDRAKEVGHEVSQKATEVAQSAAGAAQQELSKEPGEKGIGQQVQETLGAATQAGKEEAQKQGLTPEELKKRAEQTTQEVGQDIGQRTKAA